MHPNASEHVLRGPSKSENFKKLAKTSNKSRKTIEKLFCGAGLRYRSYNTTKLALPRIVDSLRVVAFVRSQDSRSHTSSVDPFSHGVKIWPFLFCIRQVNLDGPRFQGNFFVGGGSPPSRTPPGEAASHIRGRAWTAKNSAAKIF